MAQFYFFFSLFFNATTKVKSRNVIGIINDKYITKGAV